MCKMCTNQVPLFPSAAGILDFRSPGTGLYANLQQYNLPYPEAIFEISYFKVSFWSSSQPLGLALALAQ